MPAARPLTPASAKIVSVEAKQRWSRAPREVLELVAVRFCAPNDVKPAGLQERAALYRVECARAYAPVRTDSLEEKQATEGREGGGEQNVEKVIFFCLTRGAHTRT